MRSSGCTECSATSRIPRRTCGEASSTAYTSGFAGAGASVGEAIVIAARPTTLDGPTGGVLDAVASLSLDQRTTVVLKYWGGLHDHEIAEAMGIPPGTARSHLSRALSRLRMELQ